MAMSQADRLRHAVKQYRKRREQTADGEMEIVALEPVGLWLADVSAAPVGEDISGVPQAGRRWTITTWAGTPVGVDDVLEILTYGVQVEVDSITPGMPFMTITGMERYGAT